MDDLCSQLLLATLAGTRCKQAGGISPVIYAGNTGNLTGYTIDATSKAITGLTFATGKKLQKFRGRVREQSSGSTTEGGENFNTFMQTVTAVLDYNTQLELDDIEELIKAEDLFFIVKRNNGTFRVYGLNKDAANRELFPGLRHAGNGTLPDGTNLNDSTAATIPFTGQLTNAAVFMAVPSGTAAYLETLVV